MTIKELAEICKSEIEKENGEREIWLTLDGNKFFSLANEFHNSALNEDMTYNFIKRR